jgi:hypothetical protein
VEPVEDAVESLVDRVADNDTTVTGTRLTHRTKSSLPRRSMVTQSDGAFPAETSMTEPANRQAAESLFAAWERWDLDTLESLVANDAIDSRPQSGEHFVGRANIMGMYREVTGPPEITWRSIRGGPDVWVAEGIVEYGEGPVHLIGVLEFTNGTMVKGDYYFVNSFEPPESRARWAADPLR